MINIVNLKGSIKQAAEVMRFSLNELKLLLDNPLITKPKAQEALLIF